MPPALRLPAALREQIDNDLGSKHKRKKPGLSRKETRKQARQEQKQRKTQFFAHSNSSAFKPKQRSVTDEIQVEPPKKKVRLNTQNSSTEERKRSVARTKEKKLESGIEITNLGFSDDPEDARISWLEAKLGIGTSSSKKSAAFGDGLDELMGDLDGIVKRTTSTTSRKAMTSESSSSSGSDEEVLDDDNDSESAGSDFAGFSTDVYDTLSPNAEVVVDPGQVDISPNLGTSTGTHYVPPHLRNTQNDDSGRLAKLIRQLKGLLNRLSEPNLTSIINAIEEVYREYPRHDVTSSLTRLVIDAIALHSSHLDTFVVLYATLVGSLYKIVGIDFAAHFIQSLNDEYHRHYETPVTSNDTETGTVMESQGKESLNLVVLFSELYNFQIISCVLVYDIIRELLTRLNEMDVELLLKVLRNSGQQLRQDDPSALKDIVDIVNNKIGGQDKSAISSRTHFMVETLTNLKNNKLKRSANPDVHTEQMERMKKFLSGLNKKHHIKAHEPLRVSLNDLRSAEKRGKWWIVGAAWNGNPLVEKAEEIHQLASTRKQSEDSLWKLARKQGMNTDVRRSIFVVLMSSDDYIDACERLSQLKLSEVQQREIVRVVLHCLGNEKQYNPYYTLVLQQLTHNSHAFKVTLQYCFWDFLRQTGEKEVGGAEILKNVHDNEPDFDADKISASKRVHFARAFAWLIAKDHSSLLILKPVDFTRIQPQTKAFLQYLFFHIFLSSQVASPAITLNQNAAKYLAGRRKQDVLEQVFMKALRVPTLTQGLLYFIGNVLGEFDGDDEALSQLVQWGRDVASNTLHGTLDIDMEP